MSEHPQSIESNLTNSPSNVRHFMWNDDYIELLAHRLNLQRVSTLVDIGAGAGYISGIFALYMKPGSTVYAIDKDAEAMREARERVEANPFSVNFRFEEGDAMALPLPDGAADLAISQHVLMHLADPAQALAEMCRIVRPGGQVVAFEPNNMIQALVLDSVMSEAGLDQRLRLVRYQAYYERGKAKLGHGDDSIGDHLPRLFREAGLSKIEVRVSDKTAALVPPYDTEEKRARVAELLSWQDTYERNLPFIRECFLAGGGSEQEFEEFRAWELEQDARMREAIREERFFHPGGMLTYIVIGVKG